MDRSQAAAPSKPRWKGGVLALLKRWLVGPAVDPDDDVLRALAADCASARLPRVLVVDDNPVNRLLAGEMLSLWGISPMQAADGAEAAALACSHEFDLILMDLQMPVLDGLEATAQIRRFERENSCPRASVVAFTSSPFSGGESILRACGMDAVLAKPCDAETLHACLRRWCLPLHADAARAVERPRTREPVCDSLPLQHHAQGSRR